MAIGEHAKYIVDSRGKRTAIILPVKEFEAMVQELQDLRDAQYVDEAEATAEGFVSLDELRRDITRKAS